MRRMQGGESRRLEDNQGEARRGEVRRGEARKGKEMECEKDGV